MSQCAHCGAGAGGASSCPRCGRLGEAGGWSGRTATAERPAARGPVEPAAAASYPGPARYPLYADEDDQTFAETAVHDRVDVPPYLPPSAPTYAPADPDRRQTPGWLPWAIVAVVMVVV